jgi:hypothetical protein
MQTRSFLAMLAALSCGSSIVAACDGGSTSDAPADGGAKDAAVATDAPVSPGDDGGVGPDAVAACNKHLPSGFSEAVGSGVDLNFGQYVSMALDENDDPLLAYFAVKASVDGNVAPGNCAPATGSTAGCQAVYFTRWDPCAGAFTTPVVVDPVTNVYNPSGTLQVALAYDSTTKEIGIAYQKSLPTDPAWADEYGAIFLATRKPGASTFSVQQASDNVRTGTTSVSNSRVPALAMANGKLYLAFTTGTGDPAPCPSNHTCIRFLESTTSSNPDAGNPEGGPAAHSFVYSLVPNSQGFMGFAIPRELAISLAIDAMGRPAVAYLEDPEVGSNTVLSYWRAGMADSVKVTDTNDMQNDTATVNLAFLGNKPRVAALLSPLPLSYGITYVSSPDDGTTWNAAVPLLTTGGAGFYTSLAVGSAGEAISSHHNGSPSDVSVAAGCTTNPIVARSTNGGASFSGCSLSSTDVDMNGALSSAYGATRLAGKLVLVGHSRNSVADGGPGQGIIYFQDP